MQRKTNTRRRKIKKGKGGNREQLPMVRMVRLGGALFPPEMESELVFFTQRDLYTITAPYYAYPLITNAPYDVDPALGSTATQGLVEMAALYQRMRVLSYTAEVQMYNQSPWSADVFVQHTNTLNGTTAGGGNTDLGPTANNPFCTTHLLSGVYGGGSKAFRKTLSIAQVVGSPETLTDDRYASNTNSNPSDSTYLLFGAKTRNPSGTFTDPIVVSVTLRFRTRFYERKNLSA
jgi:hypothetical protein